MTKFCVIGDSQNKVAIIWKYDDPIHLGYFKDKNEAIKARKIAEEKYYKTKSIK